MSRSLKKINRLAAILLTCLFCALLLGGSNVFSADRNDQIRRISRWYEFDYLEWELEAFFHKAVQAATRAEKILNAEQQIRVVEDYLQLVREQDQITTDLKNALASPDESEKAKLKELNLVLEEKNRKLSSLAVLAEPILQNQTELSLSSLGFGLGGQVLPPVLYHVSPTPMNLIVSPRTQISTVFEVNLQPGLNLLERERIESSIFDDFSLSALVEPIGGLGAYPTMVMQTSDLAWLLETVSHEWTHNWLSFHALGLRYFNSDQLRTINETTASISGKEISRQTLMTWYPQYLPLQADTDSAESEDATSSDAEGFNFRRAMHATRVKVDALLAEGKVEEAEKYMENRRKFLWQHGYRLRKLNQAYFAFYGSYNDLPGGGAAGEDPVGPAVQNYRKRFRDLRSFMLNIATIKSFPELQKRLT